MMTINNKIACIIFFTILLFFPNISNSHGVISTVVNPLPRSVVVEAHYSDGEPMSYAKVTVTYRGKNIPFQTGYADKYGYFAFIPDEEGEWIVVFEDGMAHRSELKIFVTPDEILDNNERAKKKNIIYQSSLYLKVIMGLSIIFGLMGLISLFIKKRTNKGL